MQIRRWQYILQRLERKHVWKTLKSKNYAFDGQAGLAGDLQHIKMHA